MIFNFLWKKKNDQAPSMYQSLCQGLAKTRDRLHATFSSLLGQKSLDAATQERLLRTLISCDIGPETANYILEQTEKNLRADTTIDAETALRKALEDVLSHTNEDWQLPEDKPAVLLFVGVNGAGKTTSIGRIGHALTQEGRRVLMAAGDTFRAAAIDQLKAWGIKPTSLSWLNSLARTVLPFYLKPCR